MSHTTRNKGYSHPDGALSIFMEHSTPMHLTSSFVFEDAEEMRAAFAEEKERNIYSRFTNPNTSELVAKVSRYGRCRRWRFLCYRDGCSLWDVCRFTR